MEPCNGNELKNTLSAAKSGDQNAFETLLTQYAPLIDSLSAAFAQSATDREDLRQEACIAFCKAVEHYDTAQQSVQFGLYAKICVRNHLVSCVRTQAKQGQFVSLNEDANRPDDSDPAQTLVEEESYLTLYRRIEAVLSPYESRVWWMYLSGRTAKEIAAHFEKDERSVQNAIYRIRKKLRTTLPSP